MQVSVIIPVLNEIDQLRSNTDHFRQLELAKLELVFVDGGSCDGSWEFLQAQFANVFQTAAGRARQMNLGARVARGDYFVFLHVDTRIQVLPNAIDAFKGKNWGYHRLRLSGSAKIYRLIESAIHVRSYIFKFATGDQVLFFNKELFFEIGGFPELELMEDIAICREAKKKCKPSAQQHQVLSSSRRWQTQGALKTIIFMWYIQILFKLGVNTKVLNRLYRNAHWF